MATTDDPSAPQFFSPQIYGNTLAKFREFNCSVAFSFHPADKPFVDKLKEAIKMDSRGNERKFPVTLPDNPIPGLLAIEEADVTLIIISPNMLLAKHMNREIDIAFKYKKRVIPIVCQEVDALQVREDVAFLNWVFLRPEDDFDGHVKLLLKQIDTDIEHTTMHSKLLVYAISWERYQKSNQLLLQGTDLQRAQKWIIASATGLQPFPTQLHLDFIRTSCAKTPIPVPYHENAIFFESIPEDKKAFGTVPVPSKLTMGPIPDCCSVYISYAPEDKAFATKLVTAIAHPTRLISVDWDASNLTEEWLAQTHKRIEESDCLICILSPSSIQLDKTNWEIDHASKIGKRMVPVIVNDIDFSELRAEFVSCQLIFMRPEDDFDLGLQLLHQDVDTNAEQAAMHTKLLLCALQWETGGFDDEKLLASDDCKEAMGWLYAAMLGTQPLPTQLILDFITASMKYTRKSEAQKLFEKWQADQEKQQSEKVKAEMLHRQGASLLAHADKVSTAKKHLEEAHKLDPENKAYREAHAMALEKAQFIFQGMVVGLSPSQKSITADPTETKPRKCTIEFSEYFLKVEFKHRQGILLKKVVVVRHIPYSLEMKIIEEKNPPAIILDLYGNRSAYITITDTEQPDITARLIGILKQRVAASIREPLPDVAYGNMDKS